MASRPLTTAACRGRACPTLVDQCLNTIQGTASRPPTTAACRGRACATLLDGCLAAGAGRSRHGGRDARATSYVVHPAVRLGKKLRTSPR
jgi:hypothetical protein